MALVNCPNCGREVSEHRMFCDHCGAPTGDGSSAKGGGRSVTLTVAIVLVLVVGASVVSSVITGKSSSGSTAKAPEPDHPMSGAAHLAPHGIIVWRTKDAMDEGLRLIARGVNKTHPELVMPLSMCLPSGGEAVTILDGGLGWREVVLDTGPTKGCRGWVQRESVVQ